jgi:hypothetical protein
VILLLGAGAAAAITLGADDGGGEGGTTTVAADRPASSSSAESQSSDRAEGESNGFPPVGRPEMKEEIEDLLLSYHEDLVAQEFRSAWALLSSRKRQQDLAEYGYREWKKAQATLSDDLLPWGLEARIEALEGQGVARVMVTGMRWLDPSSPCSEWSGLTWVKYEGGVWTYDPGYSTTADRRLTWEPRSDQLLGANC